MSTVHTGDATPIGGGDRPLVAGDTVGEYEIVEQVGKGGFGTVYRATHPVIGKQVAIKVLARKYSADEAIVSRFVAEARAVNQIRHRNIIDIFSFGQLPDGRHYYVMEYLDGTPLDKHLKAKGALPLPQALPILRAIARALDAAHANNIAHRDLKPENIVLSFDEEGKSFPKLLDFGIAKLTTPDEEQAHRTGTGVPLGTPYYMSPEQCRGRDVDHRTDIYSLGVLSFRLLTGDYPFHGEMIEILHQHMHDPPPLASSVMPGLSPEVDRAIAWMMKKDPAARPQSASAAIAALMGEGSLPAITPGTLTPQTIRVGARDAAAGMDDTLASAPTVTPDLAAPRRSRTPLVVGILVACGGAGALAWWKLGGAGDAPPAPPPPGPAVVEVTPPPAPPPPTPVPAVIDAASGRVIITLDGAPEGTRVMVAGKEVGYAPAIELDRSEEPTVLALSAEGYVPTSITVTPNAAQKVNARLKRKPVGKPARPAAGGGSGSGHSTKDDLEQVPGLEGN